MSTNAYISVGPLRAQNFAARAHRLLVGLRKAGYRAAAETAI
jgi:hypothetical protein